MIRTAHNGQFLNIDFRLLDSPNFVRSTAFLLYLQLRRYVWRARNKRHPLAKVNELYAEGYLVCAVPRSTLAAKLAIREASHISRHIADLERRGLVQKVRTGRQNIYVLGVWHGLTTRRGNVVETFFPGGDVSPSDISDVLRGNPSDVAPKDTSDVSLKTPSNKEVNKVKNRSETFQSVCKEFDYVPKYEPLYLQP